MNGLIKNVLIAFAVILVVSFCCGFLGGLTNQPSLTNLGSILGPALGLITFCWRYYRQGNRKATFADQSTVARALAFKCPPDKALLYVARTGVMGFAVGVDLIVDGQPAAHLQSPRFTCLELAPGEHQVTGKVGHGTSRLLPAPGEASVKLMPGTVTVLNLAFEQGLARAKITFSPWSTQAAASKLAGIKMVLPQTSCDTKVRQLQPIGAG